MPFLHVPTFLSVSPFCIQPGGFSLGYSYLRYLLQDYGNPLKWGEPGFASFIVAICCLSSRHIDDPRVRADPSDGFSAGVQWFELFAKLRTLPNADRPTLYTVQSVFVAAVYAIGLGKLSRGFALLAEAATVSIDAGLHRSAEAYDCFDPIEEEVRKRTFWCVYMWDKQAGAVFGRPAMIRLRTVTLANLRLSTMSISQTKELGLNLLESRVVLAHSSLRCASSLFWNRCSTSLIHAARLRLPSSPTPRPSSQTDSAAGRLCEKKKLCSTSSCARYLRTGRTLRRRWRATT